MLCHVCRVHLRRNFPYCLHCGCPRRRIKPGQFVAPVLLALDSGLPEPVALVDDVTTIGRDADNDIVLGDPSISRHHARISRRGSAYLVEDLGSLNGVQIGDRSVYNDTAELTDGAQLRLGDVTLQFDLPRPEGLGSRTVRGAEHTMLGADVPRGPAPAGEPLDLRPRPRSGWALKRIPGPDPVWVLSTRSGVYLQLDERDAFIFRCVDGQNAVRDILYAYAEQFGELALPRIEKALRLFAAHELIDGMAEFPPVRRAGLRKVGHRIYSGVVKSEISIGGLDAGLQRLYRSIGWRLFTRPAVVLLWATIAVGLYSFFRAQQRQRLFDVGGAGWWGAIVVGAGYLLALAVHEAAHALAVKSYGRTVRRGGFMLMMGMPFAFVDTSDMWFGTRWSRIIVAMSGPIATAGVAGVAAMGAAWLPGSVAPALCFQLAFGLYMNTVYNFNPVMPMDGYQALTDAFRIPRLRQEATAYFTRGLWRDVAARRRPRAKQIGLTLYGLAALVGGALFLSLALIAWRQRIGPLVHDHIPAPWDTVVLVAGIMLATLPVWVRIGQRARRAIRSRREKPPIGPRTADPPARTTAQATA